MHDVPSQAIHFASERTRAVKGAELYFFTRDYRVFSEHEVCAVSPATGTRQGPNRPIVSSSKHKGFDYTLLLNSAKANSHKGDVLDLTEQPKSAIRPGREGDIVKCLCGTTESATCREIAKDYASKLAAKHPQWKGYVFAAKRSSFTRTTKHDIVIVAITVGDFPMKDWMAMVAKAELKFSRSFSTQRDLQEWLSKPELKGPTGKLRKPQVTHHTFGQKSVSTLVAPDFDRNSVSQNLVDELIRLNAKSPELKNKLAAQLTRFILDNKAGSELESHYRWSFKDDGKSAPSRFESYEHYEWFTVLQRVKGRPVWRDVKHRVTAGQDRDQDGQNHDDRSRDDNDACGDETGHTPELETPSRASGAQARTPLASPTHHNLEHSVGMRVYRHGKRFHRDKDISTNRWYYGKIIKYECEGPYHWLVKYEPKEVFSEKEKDAITIAVAAVKHHMNEPMDSNLDAQSLSTVFRSTTKLCFGQTLSEFVAKMERHGLSEKHVKRLTRYDDPKPGLKCRRNVIHCLEQGCQGFLPQQRSYFDADLFAEIRTACCRYVGQQVAQGPMCNLVPEPRRKRCLEGRTLSLPPGAQLKVARYGPIDGKKKDVLKTLQRLIEESRSADLLISSSLLGLPPGSNMCLDVEFDEADLAGDQETWDIHELVSFNMDKWFQLSRNNSDDHTVLRDSATYLLQYDLSQYWTSSATVGTKYHCTSEFQAEDTFEQADTAKYYVFNAVDRRCDCMVVHQKIRESVFCIAMSPSASTSRLAGAEHDPAGEVAAAEVSTAAKPYSEAAPTEQSQGWV
eukprot:COSAG02_NODE_507_length_20926_cov_1106.169540_2_plen_793_part_00